jgi:hypothetical protein
MGTRQITYVDPVTGLPTTIDAEDADLFGSGAIGERPATGDVVGDLWLLDDGVGRRLLQRWDGSVWKTVTIAPPPSGSADNGVPRFDGVDGQIQTSKLSIDDSGVAKLDSVGGATPDVAGEFSYDPTAGNWKFFDSTGEYDPRSGSGLSEAQHRALLQLIHFIDEGPAEGFASGATKVITYSGAFPTEVLWKRADTSALVRKSLTYTDAFPTTVEWKIYDTDGTTVLATVTDTVSYSGAFESGRTRAIA